MLNLQGGVPEIGCDTGKQGASVKVVRNRLDRPLQIMIGFFHHQQWHLAREHPASLPTGLARCCSPRLSHFQWQSDFLPAWAHRCPLCLQIRGRQGASTPHSERLMSSLGTSRPKEEPFLRLVLGDLKAISKISAKITWNMVWADRWKICFWVSKDGHTVLIKSLMVLIRELLNEHMVQRQEWKK